jgi:predicted secreted Zn-dependent protease
MRSTRYYTVDPTSVAKLTSSILEERSKGDKANAIGLTNWETRWSYVGKSSVSGCTLESVRVEVKTRISLPRWTAPASTSLARREWWNRIESAVTQHERHHVQIAEEGGRGLASNLRGLRARDCATVDRNAKSIADREMQRTRERQVEFDRADGVLTIPPPPP